MKKIIFTAIFIFGFALLIFSFAQGALALSSSSDDTAIQSQQKEEQEGKKLLDDLSNETITCSQISDSDFDKIGEYFMGQSIGDTSRHIAMNEMMKSMMGEQGEQQVHIAMGKRMSNCDPNASAPQNMMMGGSGMMGYGLTNQGMMGGNYFYGWGWFALIFQFLILVLIILAIAVLIKKLQIKEPQK